MPALILFNRRWQVGGDDLVFPALGSVIVRLAFLACAVAIFVVQRPAINACTGGHLLSGFLIGLISVLSITVALETLVGVVSGRGTITNAEPRRMLPKLLYIRTLVFFAEIGASVVGAVWIFKDWEFDPTDHSCDISVVRLVQVALVFAWFLLVVVFIGVCILFGGKHGREHNQFDNHDRWEKRCRLCCCSERKDENSQIAYAEAAAVFATIFQNYDLVLSDIVAGLILAQVEQERRIQERMPNALPTKDPGPDVALPGDPVETRLETVQHYYQYSMASNGWPLLAQSDLGCWLCKLCCSGKYCGACRKGSEHIRGDNCCQCNTTAVRAMASADEEDLLFLSFHNKIFQSPFYVVLDHEHKSVVVAIRGTLSFQDILTDISAAAEKLDVEGHDIYGHRGVVNNSKNILARLREEKLLENAFERHPSYKLVIVGHSLGAGVATILSILLREEYPDIKTFAFSPPGGLVNAEGVLYTQDFVTAVVLGMDVVPRMSMCNLQQLRDQILELLRSCSVPKYRVLLQGLWYTCRGLPENLPVGEEGSDTEGGMCCNPRQPLLSHRGGHSPLETPSPNTDDQPIISLGAGNGRLPEGGIACIDVDIDEPGPSSNGAPTSRRGCKEFMPLFTPGHMIWIQRREMHSGKCCGSQEEYCAQWVPHRQFDHIAVRPGMIKDHLPLDINNALAWLVDRVKNGRVVHPDLVD